METPYPFDVIPKEEVLTEPVLEPDTEPENKQKAIFLVGHGSRFRCLLNELLHIVQQHQNIHRFKNCAVFKVELPAQGTGTIELIVSGDLSETEKPKEIYYVTGQDYTDSMNTRATRELNKLLQLDLLFDIPNTLDDTVLDLCNIIKKELNEALYKRQLMFNNNVLDTKQTNSPNTPCRDYNENLYNVLTACNKLLENDVVKSNEKYEEYKKQIQEIHDTVKKYYVCESIFEPITFDISEDVLETLKLNSGDLPLTIFFERHGAGMHKDKTQGIRPFGKNIILDPGLTPAGIEQARATGRKLREHINGYDIVYGISDLRRTRETMRYTWEGMEEAKKQHDDTVQIPVLHEPVLHVVPCLHETASEKAGCDKKSTSKLSNLIARENMTLCGGPINRQLWSRCKPADGFTVDWTIYDKFYRNKGRSMMNLFREQCRNMNIFLMSALLKEYSVNNKMNIYDFFVKHGFGSKPVVSVIATRKTPSLFGKIGRLFTRRNSKSVYEQVPTKDTQSVLTQNQDWNDEPIQLEPNDPKKTSMFSRFGSSFFTRKQKVVPTNITIRDEGRVVGGKHTHHPHKTRKQRPSKQKKHSTLGTK